MGFLDRLFGDKTAAPARASSAGSADEQAIARYRYLLRTAPPEAVEQAHAEAFAQLTPAQRAEVLRGLSEVLPPGERAAAGSQGDPQSLARMATRTELRQPGTMERVFGGRGPGYGGGPGIGLGGLMAGSLLSSIAGTFIGSAIAHQFLGGFDASPEAGNESADSGGEEPAADSEYADSSAADEGGGDVGGGDDFGGGFDDV